MKATGGRRASLAVIVTATALTVPATAGATPDVVDASVTAAPSASVARTGDRVVVRGRVSGGGTREVRLLQLVGRSWRTVDSQNTSGSFILTVPSGDAGVSSYRVVAPADGGHGEATSDTFTVGIGDGDPRAYDFLTTPPVRWDPCTAIGYRVNLAGAPDGALDDIKGAIGRTAMASGLKFSYEGTTKIVPGARSADAPENYPDDTVLVVAYATPAKSKLLAKSKDLLGFGGVFYDLTPQRVGKNTWYRAVQGYVVLNVGKELPGGFGPGRRSGELGTWGQVLMHEIGHAVGLDHPAVADKAQIMYGETTYKDAQWGVGDLTALRRLGAASGCFAAPKGRSSASYGGARRPPTAGVFREPRAHTAAYPRRPAPARGIGHSAGDN